MDDLTGIVERITYYNPENAYSVLRLRSEATQHLPGLSRDGLVTVVGNLPELAPGEHLRLRGRWDNHPRHGQQFKAEFCEQTLPASVAGIESYLGSGMVKGIGPRLAERIVAYFGASAIDVIEQSILVDFDPDNAGAGGRAAAYDWSEADELTLAYAISVHKAQGSEFPAVVLPVVTQHYMMLQRNLLYTAVTRAKTLCVLAGNRRAIGMAVRNNQVAKRFTALEWRLGKP